MTGAVRRAGAFTAVGSLAIGAPALGRYAPVPFLIVAGLAAFVISEGRLFELFARPGDHEEASLHGLAGFALAAAGLALLATEPVFGMPTGAFVASVLLLSCGNLGEKLVRSRREGTIAGTVGFGAGAAVGAGGGVALADLAGLIDASPPAKVLFLLAAGTLLAALLRSVLFPRDDPLVMVSVGLLSWFLASLVEPPTMRLVVAALAVTVALGYVSYALDTASVTGMLTGVFLGLLTLVLGGPAWFAVLIAFFGVGGLATKFRYEQKRRRGVAEENEGARGSGNVLGNSSIALLALLGFTGASATGQPTDPFVLAYAGAIATAMSDTLSSEVGGVYDNPRLITTREVVSPGTDGGVTWQGLVAGTAGAGLVAGIALALFGGVDLPSAGAVALAGFVGMNVDSVLGATIEGRWLGNQSVNFVATLSGALVGAAAALVLTPV